MKGRVTVSLCPCFVLWERSGSVATSCTRLTLENHVISWCGPAEQSVSQEAALGMTLITETASVPHGGQLT